MKNLAFIFVAIIMLSSCSFYSKKSNADADYKEEKNLTDDSANQFTKQKLTVNTEEKIDPKLSQAKRILKKKINTETFEKDIKAIREADLYDSLVCASLKNNVMINNYSGAMLNMTYQTALEASKEGKERARRIENIVSE